MFNICVSPKETLCEAQHIDCVQEVSVKLDGLPTPPSNWTSDFTKDGFNSPSPKKIGHGPLRRTVGRGASTCVAFVVSSHFKAKMQRNYL